MLLSRVRQICDLADRFKIPDGADNGLFIADKGFFSFNALAHFIHDKLFFLIRIRDGIVANLIPEAYNDSNEADIEVERIITRTCSKKKWKHPDKSDEYKVIRSLNQFDYLPVDSDDEVFLNFRVIKLKLKDDLYEYLVTNLPQSFTIEDMRTLYKLRWNEETSFRRLKHTIGGTCFLSNKTEYVTQEIWARMILFNFCMQIARHIKPRKVHSKYDYQLNYDDAMKTCHYYLRLSYDKDFNLEVLIRSSILPISPGQSFGRHKLQTIPLKFAYRR